MDDITVQPHIFHAAIPVCFRLQGLRFPLYLLQHLSEAAPDAPPIKENSIFFSHQSTPLKWCESLHYPIGLLYDLLHERPAAPFLSASAPASDDQEELAATPSLPQPLSSPDLSTTAVSDDVRPFTLSEATHPYTLGTVWTIDVHLHDPFPSDKILAYSGSDTLESAFMNTVKEADYMRNGSAKKVMGLTKAQQLQLWQGIINHDYSQLEEIQGLLLDSVTRLLPIRIYDKTTGATASLPDVYQVPFAVDKAGTLRELGQAVIAQQQRRKGATSAVTAEQLAFLVHGNILSDLDTPLPWLYRHFVYPDGWLHIAAILTG
ncbi:Autophagy protein 5 [Sorochytrium milnesiophthora]